MSKTYYDKLKDPRWIQFRNEFLARHRSPDGVAECSDCGESTTGPLVPHHRRYYPGRDPWGYDDEDLLLICKECHDRIHTLENRVRDMVRSLEPNECYEFNVLLDALDQARERGLFKVAAARAKNVARRVAFHPEDDRGIRHISELMTQAMERYEAIHRDQ